MARNAAANKNLAKNNLTKNTLKKNNSVNIEFHSHTNYSRDCPVTLETFRKNCLKKNIIPCITDHNTIKGALEYQRRYGKDSCIVGEEIKTLQGEVIGLYIEEEIPKGLDIKKTLRLLNKQGAIVIVPHPFDRLRTSRLQLDIDTLEGIHIIETFNSRTVFAEDNKRAEDFVKSSQKNYLTVVGSDAHTPYEIGRSYVVMPKFDVTDKEDFIRAISSGKTKAVMRKSTLFVHVVTKALKMMNRKAAKSDKNTKNK